MSNENVSNVVVVGSTSVEIDNSNEVEKVAPVVGGKFNMLIELEKLGETVGDYKAYDAQLPIVEIAGTRIVKCLYQVSKQTGKKVAENSYVRIPVQHISEEVIVERIAELAPYVVNFLQEEENNMIKDEHKQGIMSVYVENLTLDRLIERLEASEAGARLNKDKITAWFNEFLKDSLTVRFAEKLGLDDTSSEEELNKLSLVIVAYTKKFESLAGGKTFIKEEDCKAMIAVISSVEEAEESILGRRFIAKLEGMSKKEEDLLLSL